MRIVWDLLSGNSSEYSAHHLYSSGTMKTVVNVQPLTPATSSRGSS